MKLLPLTLLLISSFAAISGFAGERPNILFIAVDDLRLQSTVYGQNQMKTPGLSRLADESVVFSRAYCSVPVCGASRASLMTGVRPTADRFFNYYTRKDRDLPEVPSVAKWFKDHGYTTISNGKIYHHTDDDLVAWSERPWGPPSKGIGWQGYLTEESKTMILANQTAENPNQIIGPATENADVDDNMYPDGMLADKAIEDLKRFAKSGEPFFLGVGFWKPHLPFNAPKKYWDLYNPEDIELADNPYQPKDSPDAAMHRFGELRDMYGDIPQDGPISDELARRLIHGYFAAVSYSDAQINKLLDTLEETGLAENTIVVLWGDHGYHLGEHGLWCKHANFDRTMNAPLIVKAPGIKGGVKTSAITEFIDIYPTLCELADLPIPGHLDGKSFVSELREPDNQFKEYAYSRYHWGESIISDQHIYTEWINQSGELYGRMLYDHENDPAENLNVSESPEYAGVVEAMKSQLEDVRQSIAKKDFNVSGSIKKTYADYFPVGTAISYREVMEADPERLSLIKNNFSILTAENCFKWDAIHPEEDRYDFVQADKVAEFARANGYKLWGHVLVWHHQTPEWIFKDGDSTASRELVLKRMREHIHTVMNRYKDVIYGWDVVNEAISDEEDVFLYPSKWLEIVGEDFIEKAFLYAMEAGTGALLSYNDYSLPDPPKRKKLVRLISGLLEKGIQVDTVGFQSHYNLYYPELEELAKSIKAVSNMGLKVSVSEIDMSVFDMGDKSDRYSGGLPGELEIYQGIKYANLMSLYQEYAGDLERVTFWGIYDADNWRNYWPVDRRTDYAGLINREGRAKSAYSAVINPSAYLEEHSAIEEPVSPHLLEEQASTNVIRPDLFFYLADDQNYWDYGFAGNDKVSTPNVDKLVNESLLFTRAYTSMAICSPSRNSLYTGLYPLRNGCYMNHIRSRNDIRSVAQYLKDLGYTVILAGKSHVNPNSVFDWSHHWPTVPVRGEKGGRLPLEKVEEFLRTKEGPACVFFASEFPHGPYPDMPALDESEFSPKPYQSNNFRARKRTAGYYENIRKDDQQLGQLVEMLKGTGNWENDVFFYASDHGIDGKYTTFDRGLRVPLIMRWKGQASPGGEIDALVHFVDIVPTMVEIAGGEANESLDGTSILPLVKGDADAIHEAVYGLQTYQNIQDTRVFPGRSITTGRYKLSINFNAVEALEKNYGDNTVVNEFLQLGAQKDHWRRFIELYDLSADPFEQDNLGKKPEFKELRQQLMVQLLQWMGEQGDFIELGKPLPLLKPTLHPLDKTTRFKNVPGHLEGRLKPSDYMQDHY
ncbi:sulfatase-like hydrolase/transferase [Puniceicoccales bacterium CK1056]|uniref:Beta-xylanase n=1 Tax=Oceanipulchritudo coccoides TaxID=2706888 RepID=A0A6B2LYW3_9BACT|nr:endo-1,4-beta-xylanase [Oceanipulchritudo coccoides]NDV61881.1 sulfatase-like hydrolase/transferase [Oceanipulchritudo coccoides]